MSFAYRCTITPLAAQVPSPQSNFAVFVSVTDNALKDIAHGGPCRADGFDIRAFSDIALTSTLYFYRTFYDGTAGTWQGFIKVTTLDVGSPYRMGVGNPALTTDANDGPNTFSNSYECVIPMRSTSDLNDITGNSRNVSSSANISNGSNILGGGVTFTGLASSYIKILNWDSAGNQPRTVSVLAYWNTMATYGSIINKTTFITGGGGDGCYMLSVDFNYTGTNNLHIRMNQGLSGVGSCGAVSTGNSADNVLATGVVKVIHANDNGGFVNGVAGPTGMAGAGFYTNGDPWQIGSDTGDFTKGIDGDLRMFMSSSVDRSQDWITTEAKEFTPATFASYVFEPLSSGIGARFIRNSNGIWVFNTGGGAQGNLRGGF